MSVLVFVESDGGKVKNSSLEAVVYGREVAKLTSGSVVALAMGDGVSADGLASLGKYGAEKVFHASDSKFNEANINATSSLVASVAKESAAQTVVMARSSLVDAIASRVAIKLGAGVAANVVAVPDVSAGFVVKRGVYTSKAFANVSIPQSARVLTIAKNAVGLEAGEGTAEVVDFNTTIDDTDFTVKRVSVEKAEGDVLLPEADMVVSAGRGLKGPENWGMIESLAKTLGAATACSKPVSDMDWRPHHEHVGQTGIKISPNLYIAVGISGAIQHLAGVNSSKVIVAINKDPEAPFFKAADYGVVGDAFEVVPKLEEALKAAL
ncbi:electron transfer flavoprotein subunit alpha/FixB family protein [Flammeovirgaceae bacterium SG7u.111]|nr:electron transfer flavoprotein subunit alpha/FixB family protein [Flammeovirgaceae bacterium SG7u.132]WPO37393.1 electron transfer flavoprotein subunit alpha/FixB family protein [Flammeovirgaceae bacterium SG7u.111]